MNDINTVTLVGRLTRDAELKYSQGGLAICEFSIACNASIKRGDEWQDEPNFFDVALFGRQGEAVAKYLEKGKQIAVHGSLKQSRWEKDGQKRSKVSVIAQTVQLLGSKSSSPVSAGPDDAPADPDVVPF